MKVTVGIRLSGNDLDPAQVTAATGRTPTFASAKGERRPSKASRGSVRQPTGVWILDSPVRETEPLSRHLRWCIQSLRRMDLRSPQLAGVRERAVVVGIFLEDSNEAVDLLPNQLAALARAEVEVTFDIYFVGRGSSSIDQDKEEAVLQLRRTPRRSRGTTAARKRR